jgi:serine/threonine protein kinase
MTEVLELLAQQSPPLVHGFIRPEHILITRDGSQCILTNFSIVLAGGATQFIAGIDRSRLSPYTAPEFVRGIVDVRSDLYSLVATAYHAVTGSVPTTEVSGFIPQAQRLNPNVSPRLDAILTKGLRAVPSQRYQRPSELRQELLSLRSLNESLLPRSDMLAGVRTERPVQAQMPQPAQTAPDGVAQILPSILAPAVEVTDEQERKLLLPRPEELPAMKERNDVQDAVFWLVGMVLCLIVIVVLSRGLI